MKEQNKLQWPNWLLTLIAIPFIPFLFIFIRIAAAMEAAEKEYNDEGTGRKAGS